MEQAQEQVNAKLFGVPLSIKGLNMVVFLALVAVTSYTIYYLSVVVSREHVVISNSVTDQTSAIKDLTKVLNEQNYILLADERETANLRRAYRMPPSLREKLIERDTR